MGRRKNRWVLAKIQFPERCPDDGVRSRVQIREAFETELIRVCDILFGTIGGGFVADATNVVLINEAESVVLFQTKRCFLQKVICVLRCLDRLQKVPISLQVFHVGGTLHQCKRLLFSSLLATLSQLQTLKLTGATPRSNVAQRTISSINDVSRIRNPTDP